MSNKPKISIIMPVYNGEKTISKAIESVIIQNYENTELLIMDGKSTDNTLSICETYKNKYNFIKIYSEKDKGQSDAFNKGVSLSSGEIIGWLNADDYYEKEAFNTILKYDINSWDIIYGNCYYADSKGNIIRKFKSRKFLLKDFLIKGYCYIPPMSCFIKKYLYDKIKPEYLNTNYHYAMDYDLILKLSKFNPKFLYINEYLSTFVRGEDNKTVKFIKKMRREGYSIAVKYGAGKYPLFWLNVIISEIYFLLPDFIKKIIRKIRYKF